MKNKFLKNICVSSLIMTFAFSSFTACDWLGGKSASKDEDAMATSVWSVYGTAKVTQNVKESVPYEKLDASVDVQMMKNEVEGAQLVITAGKDIKSYDLITSELSDGKGNSISKENISV